MSDDGDGRGEELYDCYWCEQQYTEDDMYGTGYNHDPMCHECHSIEVDREEQTGIKYIWYGDKRYRINN